MSVEAGTRNLKTWKGSYDFAIDGGATGTLVLRSDDGQIPNGSVILGGWLDNVTAETSGGSATVAVQIEAANDTVNAAAISGAPWSTTGRKSIIPVFTGATTLKTTADRSPSAVIATAALTAGKFDLYVIYR